MSHVRLFALKKLNKYLCLSVVSGLFSTGALATPKNQLNSIDLMVLYTDGAELTEQSYGQGTGIDKRVSDLVKQLNKLYKNNSVNVQLNLVYSALTKESDINRLDTITVGNHSVSITAANRQIRDLRAQYGADFVLILTSVPKQIYDGTCGVASTSGSLVQKGRFSLQDRDQAYAVVSIDKETCDTFSRQQHETLFDEVELVAAHELGHLMGLNHDHKTERQDFNELIKDNELKSYIKEVLAVVKKDEYVKNNNKLPPKGTMIVNDPTFDDFKQISGGLYDYSFGYGVDDRFTTIMGYTHNYDAENQNWLPYFSTSKSVDYTVPIFRIDKANLVKNLEQVDSMGEPDSNNLQAINQAAKQLTGFCPSADASTELSNTNPKAVKLKGMQLNEFSLIHAYSIDFDKTPLWSPDDPNNTKGFYPWQDSELLTIVDLGANKRLLTVTTTNNTIPAIGLDLTCSLQQNETYRFSAEVQGGDQGIAALWLYYETAQGTQDWILIDYKTVDQLKWTTLTGDIKLPSQLSNVRLLIAGAADGIGFSLKSLNILTKRKD
ncbi:carbohydrate binding domain-containing protein [Endozoicomonas sp. SM1973]|uniref:Carbohydrate binding domain-containing protein n=1 Tax=Spartinivicinus marinus TaxID=2994442 RepID=A0A853IIR8_9GAMM|nr:zinc-dependent metalloprotease family protein [Spartinivicinus marinus]MCX4029814.1 M12 family metallo-peptidase [Spartinivicinus marinus]NYZ67516.1 carbohydrate binding domain-containing protein [Spartinivicinus marinus]